MPGNLFKKVPDGNEDVISRARAVKKKDEDDRGTWSNKLDFIMSAISFAVGMGNIWRFPYICYRNGGGAFLIPYIIMVIFAGIPMMFLEMSIGQYASLGPVSVWKACPLFQGIGWSMFAISFISCIYYNMLVGYSFFYTFASLASDVPWRHCENWWNTDACGGDLEWLTEQNCTKMNMTWFNHTCHVTENLSTEALSSLMNATNTSGIKPKSPADEYFHHYVLDISEGIEEVGGIRWNLALCLLLCWLVVFICLSLGIKSLGKATYFTSLFPYAILLILFVRGLTLEGSADGVIYYLTPQWSRLASAKVWGDAAVQVFFSMSTCWGGLIALASYNKFENNCLRDSIVVAVGDCLTSIFAGVVIFAVIGYLANELNVPIDEVATQGAGLAFIVYPSAVTRLPISPLWSVLFMLVLVNLGLGTQFTLVTTAHTTILDVFSKHLRKGRRPLMLLAAICVFCAVVGLIFTTNGGMYILQWMDSYAPSYTLLVVGVVECIVLSWVYGLDRYFKDLEQMLGYRPSKFWFACWGFITPSLIVFVLVFTIVDFKTTSYGDYQYPFYTEVIGWIIVLIEMACIPGVAIYKIFTTHQKLPLLRRIRRLLKPADDWGPAQDRNNGSEKESEVHLPLNDMSHINANNYNYEDDKLRQDQSVINNVV